MSNSRITVALLTRNRPNYLRQALDSILAQQGAEFEVLVLDNASTDDTPDVIRAYAAADARVIYMPNGSDIGAVRNWNRGIELGVSRSPFVSIFHDDDIMLPGFFAASLAALEPHPTAGMSLCMSDLIGSDGARLTEPKEGEMPHPGELKDGLIQGLDFLELTLDRRGMRMGIYPTSVLFRSSVLMRIGLIDSPHVRATADMNLYYRLARVADIVFIRQVLGQWRQHRGSESDRMGRMADVMFRYGVVAEVADIAAYLLQTERAADPAYRQWLAERMLALHAEQSELIRPLCPSAYHTWEYRRDLLCGLIEKHVPPEQPFILLDDEQLAMGPALNGRRIIPFLERNGEYAGPPSDSRHSIDELERLRAEGKRWLVVGFPSLWWLEMYADFALHLKRNYRLVTRDPHGMIFSLSRDGQPA